MLRCVLLGTPAAVAGCPTSTAIMKPTSDPA